MTAPEHRTPHLAWNAWGADEEATPLSDGVRALLEEGLGVPHRDTPSVTESDVHIEPSALSADAAVALREVLGAENVRADDAARLRHCGGKSTPDLLRRRAGDAAGAPDAVVYPADHDEVQAVLRTCSEHRVAVVTFGGGTSVVGGLEPERGPFGAVVALDLHRLDTLVAIDTESGIATLQAGVRGPEAEELLAEHGFSLGHFPQSFQFATIGGFAATRSSGQNSAGYGRFDDMVANLRVATPRDTLALGRGPASAAGPDLRQLFLGSEGTLGVITEVGVRVHPVPETTEYEAWSFADFATGAAALRTLAQVGALPTVARLSDETETALNLALADDVGEESPSGGCLMITNYEGRREHVTARHAEAAALLRAAGGTSLGAVAARSWEHGRFNGPHLRDSLLDVNGLTETLETATTWSNLTATYQAVNDALTQALTGQETPPIVMCHISHVYPEGASLYFTVVCARADDPVSQWLRAKHAAGDAIAAAGATITHHHAVGLDHRPWMPDEVGDLGIELLRSLKSTVDPVGVLNPGKLVPPPGETPRGH